MRDYLHPPFIPPFWLILSILSMVGLDQIEGASHIVPADISWVGWLLIGGGLAVAVFVDLIFKRRGTTILPFRESSVLVTEGPFRYSRNPIYCGMTAALIGLGLLMGTAAPFIVVPAFVLIIDRCFIRSEEAVLETTFGDEYRDYKTRVRRWI